MECSSNNRLLHHECLLKLRYVQSHTRGVDCVLKLVVYWLLLCFITDIYKSGHFPPPRSYTLHCQLSRRVYLFLTIIINMSESRVLANPQNNIEIIESLASQNSLTLLHHQSACHHWSDATYFHSDWTNKSTFKWRSVVYKLTLIAHDRTPCQNMLIRWQVIGNAMTITTATASGSVTQKQWIISSV